MIVRVCQWVGQQHEGCRRPTIFGKSYCEEHHQRVFMKCPVEMADYIVSKEVSNPLDIIIPIK